MKRLFWLLVLVLTGCSAMGWKPSDDQLNQYQAILVSANTTEATLFIAFDAACTSKAIPDSDCVIGYSANTAWDTVYKAALKAIADYRAGIIDSQQMKTAVNTAIDSSTKTSQSLKALGSNKASTLKLRQAVQQK